MKTQEHAFPLLLIECLTSPRPEERTFIEQLLAFSTIRSRLPLALFLHQPEKSQPEELVQPGSSAEECFLLYLCGGRVRATDWYQLTRSQDAAASPFLATRQVRSQAWFCYARCQDALWAAAAFEKLESGERERLARTILLSVQNPTDYPSLPLASEIAHLDLPTARRAFPPLEYACAEPRTMAKYFYRLRRWAIQAGEPRFVALASLNYLASLLCCSGIQTLRLYQVLRRAPVGNEKRSLARLYGELGQRLVKAKDQPSLEAAAECFRMSRLYIDETENLEPAEKQSALAAIANGEALLAFKQGQPERACQIEQSGLDGLPHGVSSSLLASQEALLRTNLGDVYLRLLRNREAAIKQYQVAYTLALRWSSTKMACYVVPKFADALIHAGQAERASEMLEQLLAHAGGIDEKSALKARLTLAQISWQSQHYRRAALWYWRLLKRPQGLALSTLQGIAFNLQQCRPEMSAILRARLNTIVVNQQEMLTSLTHIRVCLAQGDR
jgi:tetratricopeptide (TPR) repeat protein